MAANVVNLAQLRRRSGIDRPFGAGVDDVTIEPQNRSIGAGTQPQLGMVDQEPQLLPQADGSVLIHHPSIRRSRREKGKFSENLALDPDVPLATIANECLEGFEDDQSARRDWLDTARKGKEYLGVDWTDAAMNAGEGIGTGNISRIKDGLLLEACLKSWANSRAELIPANGPAKVRDDLPADSEDMQAEVARAQAQGRKPRTRSQKAEDFETDFNHYLMVTDTDYVQDFSQMLMNRTGIGIGFRKCFRHPFLRRPVSRSVSAENLVVSNDASTLDECSRVSEIIVMRRNNVRRMQRLGLWRDIGLFSSMPQFTSSRLTDAELTGINITAGRPDDYPITVIEQIVDLDFGPLGEDETGEEPGWALPYVVTLDKESREVLSIVRFWKEGDENYMRRRRYVKYGFVPGFGTGIYNWGFFHILGNPERAATAISRILIDGGMYGSFPGGLIAKGPGSRQGKMTLRSAPGEFIPIDTGGQPISEVVSPYPYKEPSQVLAAALTEIKTDARRLAGVMEMPIGEGRVGDVPVATIMAFIDSLQKVPSAVHKDDHISLQTELRMLRDLFLEDPGALARYADKPRRQWAVADEFADHDLVPASDPNIASHVHRIMQAQGMVELAAMPQFQGIANVREIYQEAVATLGKDVDRFTLPPQAPQPPPPDPKIIAAQISAQAKQQETTADLEKAKITADAKTQTATLAAQQSDADRASNQYLESMRLAQAQTEHQTQTQADLAKHAVGLMSDHVMQGNEHALDHAHHVDDLGMQQAQMDQTAQQAAQAAATKTVMPDEGTPQ